MSMKDFELEELSELSVRRLLFDYMKETNGLHEKVFLLKREQDRLKKQVDSLERHIQDKEDGV